MKVKAGVVVFLLRDEEDLRVLPLDLRLLFWVVFLLAVLEVFEDLVDFAFAIDQMFLIDIRHYSIFLLSGEA